MAIAQRVHPRISANDLALYMVSSDTARLGIIRRSKAPQLPPVTRYRDVRPVVCNHLVDDTRSVRALAEAERMFAQRADDPAESPLRQDDSRNSVEVLRALQGMANQLAPYTFRLAPADQARLRLGGVEVSVRVDLMVTGVVRGEARGGAAMLRMTQDDAETEAARGRRRDIGLYAATLVRLHVDHNLRLNVPVANRFCLSLDIQHGEAFAAPDSNARRTRDLEAACQAIAALWPRL